MSWKLKTQTQEISMVDRLVHYARTHNCTATDAAQEMRDILRKSPALDDVNAAQAILDLLIEHFFIFNLYIYIYICWGNSKILVRIL